MFDEDIPIPCYIAYTANDDEISPCGVEVDGTMKMALFVDGVAASRFLERLKSDPKIETAGLMYVETRRQFSEALNASNFSDVVIDPDV